MIEEAFRLVRKRTDLDYAEGVGIVSEACREFEVPRSAFSEWKKAYTIKW